MAPAIDVTPERDGVVVVSIRHGSANALDPTLLAAALEVLDDLRAEPPGAVVLTGSGRFFSAGADLKIVPTLSPDDQAAMARGVNRLFSEWYGFPRPLVCAVNGHAVAGGLVLALCGDHRVVGRSGRFGLTEVKVGIPYPSAAMMVVRRELTPAVARQLVLRGELFDAGEALRLGVFDEAVDDDDVLPRAVEVAAQMAALPPTTFSLVKQRLRGDDTPGSLGGAAAAGWATAEAPVAAKAVLEREDR